MNSVKIFIFLLITLISCFNSASAIKCLRCSGENSKCSQQPEKLNSQECSSQSDKCFTFLNTNGHIFRDCYSENHHVCKKDDPNCLICSDDGCNNKIVPEDRIKCFHCRGSDCLNPSQDHLMPCNTYKKDDECYVYSGINEFHRGCNSDSNFECDQNKEFCKMCNDSACNDREVKPITCYNCRSEDGKCKRPEKLNVTIDCEPDSDGNSCFVHVSKSNMVSRGCAREKVYIEGGHFIDICKDSKCNDKPVEDINCPQCHVDKDKDCATKDFKPDWIKDKCPEFTSVCHTKCYGNDEKIFRGCGKMPADTANCTFCFNNCDTESSHEGTTQNPITSSTSSSEGTNNPSSTKGPSTDVSCYRCRSDADRKCAYEKVPNIKPEICKSDQNVKGCYTETYGSIVIRSCQSVLSKEELEECKSNKGYCQLCESNDCNNGKAPNAAIRNSISIFMLISIIGFYIMS